MAEYIVAVKTFDDKGMKTTTSYYKVKGQSTDKVKAKLIAETKDGNVRISAVCTKSRFIKNLNDFINLGVRVEESKNLLEKLG